VSGALQHIEGFEAPIHRALVVQQWIAGLIVWALGHTLAVFAAKRDPDFAPVLVRHLRQRGHLSC
jgi:type IV secretion system protein TrbD